MSHRTQGVGQYARKRGAPRIRTVKYKVWYGNNNSYQPCYNLADVNHFIAHCLRGDTPITGVTKA